MKASVRLWRRDISLKRPFKTALRTVSAVEDLVLEISIDGQSGYGSAAPTVAITGDSIERMSRSIERDAVPMLRGWSGTILEPALILANRKFESTSARFMTESALFDLAGVSSDRSVASMLGGVVRSELPNDITISLNSPDEMAADAADAVGQGVSILKLKVGNDTRQDMERLDAICHVISDSTVLRLDANQAWNVEEARFLLKEFEKRGYPIDVIEQPVPAKELDGLRRITEFSPYPVMADESLFNADDAVALIALHAADILNIKLAKCGGFLEALKICRLAEDAGLECMLGCMMEGPVGIVAACNLAVSQRVISRIDLDSPLLYDRPAGRYSTRFEADRIVYTEASGLGIEDAALDEANAHLLWEIDL